MGSPPKAHWNPAFRVPFSIMRPTSALQDHHGCCDELFADAEAAAHSGHWDEACALFARFAAELNRHFLCEETVLFPAFEERTGMTAGPTEVMRGEHADMRDLLGRMTQACGAHNLSDFSGSAETLLILMQQHNLKEENILYPMCDSALSDRTELGAAIERCVTAVEEA